MLLEDTLAIAHGSLAQAFFALLSAIALLTSRAAAVPPRGADPAVRRVACAAAAVVYLQIVFGALLTHAGWLWLHVGGALAVFAVVPSVTARLRGSGDPVAAPIARALLVLLGLQLLLGVGSFLARSTAIWIPGGQTTPLVLPVAHRLVGSLILGAVVILALRVSGHPQSAAAPGTPAMTFDVMASGARGRGAPESGHPRSAAAPGTPLR